MTAYYDLRTRKVTHTKPEEVKQMKIKVGHDSEVFAKRVGVGMFPMIGHVGGTKDNPLPVPGGVLTEDNVSIEMAINPTADEDEFVALTKQVMEEMEKKIQENGCTMVVEPSVEFRREIINIFSPTSQESGCDPDYNIYTKAQNQYPPMEETLFRHGSGHLHVDCPKAVQSPKLMASLIMLQDVLIKLPQWLLEGDVERNTVQGALGNYRPKVYGAEYRSSSNIILKDEKILRHAFSSAQLAVTKCNAGHGVQKQHMNAVKEAMQNGDKKMVSTYISYYGGTEIAL